MPEPLDQSLGDRFQAKFVVSDGQIKAYTTVS